MIIAVLAVVVASAPVAEAKRAKTKNSKSTRSLSKTTKHMKKVTITFDGTSSESSSSGELGDEIPAPRAMNRKLGNSNSVVQLRGNSIDDIWDSSKSPTGSHTVAKHLNIDEENPDLMEPVSASLADSQTVRSKSRIDDLNGAPDLDESALAGFKKSARASRKSAVTKPVKVAKRVQTSKPLIAALPKALPKKSVSIAKAEPRQPKVEATKVVVRNEEPIQFDDVKPVPAKTLARPVTRTYTRNSKPVAAVNALPAGNSLATVQRYGSASEFSYNVAFENTLTMGRAYQLQTVGDRNFAMKNELFFGSQHVSGWGAKLSASFITTSNDDRKKDVSEFGDPSIVIAHPSIVKTRDLDVYGRVRYYLPLATSSKKVGLQHFAYYLLTDVQLPAQMIVSNSFQARYFQQSAYADTDAFALLYDATEFSKKYELFRFGLGQQTSIESHQVTAPGTTVEAYPFVDFIALANTLLEAKLYVPLYAVGQVVGGPTGVSLSNVQAEFFAKIAF